MPGGTVSFTGGEAAMDVHINEVVSTVRAARGDVSQGKLEDTVRAVLRSSARAARR